ncbi:MULTISPECIES: ammonium transporter [Acidiphilium]|uniref:Ammonium transporter n=2 Tax=Acidiphilium TaxID=522 RepID=A5G2I6_ACICJ|nr:MULTISPECIES: ammonium transporter [Acidiphilium]MBU6356775.1 ammonium transporter [Rhodospirillales bacterium]ABQ32068.1 ammonium transporter [Acidiphilium cryptum JF-5]EGO94222.1 Ammonium transporter [Acidiphilium sp. PM]KDM67751.1 ammonium transporter NrgA [Acidiphilium sp. JA12-A1]MDE2327281.1 ammonium transporter [Rhodospirillales bacterium]
MTRRLWTVGALSLPLAGICLPAKAAESGLSAGDTAWMLVSSVLVLLMTIPGLVLFYGGMVRKKNVLSIMMQSVVICAVVSVLWLVVGYSLAFSNGNGFVGGLGDVLLENLARDWNLPFTLGTGLPDAVHLRVPESVFVMFQLTFAIITPAVITGSFAERMKFSALLIVMAAWSLLVYAPIAHWVWSPAGWLYRLGIADYAGGTVVEVNSGIAGLVCALYLGRRLGFGQDNMMPWNLSYAVMGASLLWVGWLGFNSGGAGGANPNAGMAVLVTQMAAAGATLSWTAVEWAHLGRPTVLGAISGAVAGLVAITPAAGFLLPGPALLLGLAAGVVCFWAVTVVKIRLRYDDSLDAFGVHGVAGILGTLATGVLAFGPLSGGAVEPGLHQLAIQALGVAATMIYCGVVTAGILFATQRLVGLRVTRDEERQGLDEVLHGESIA